jgi:hypothetical protein
LLVCTSCESREFRKYSIERKSYNEFSVIARLDGTYYPYQKEAVSSPYCLYVSVTPNKPDSVRLSSLRLIDAQNKTVLNIDTPKISKEDSDHRPAGFFVYYKNPPLNLDYDNYTLLFKVQLGDETPIEIILPFQKKYTETISSDWWDDASSI